MLEKSNLENLISLKRKISQSGSPVSLRNKLQKQLFKDHVITGRELRNLARNSAILQQRLEGIGPYQTESEDVWNIRIDIFKDTYTDILSCIAYNREKIEAVLSEKTSEKRFNKKLVDRYISNLRVLIDNLKINYGSIDHIRMDILNNHLIPDIISEEEFNTLLAKLKELTKNIRETKKKLRILSFDTKVGSPDPWRYLINLLFASSYEEKEFNEKLDETLRRTLDKDIVDALTRQEVLIEIIRYEELDINRLRTAKLQFLTKTLTRDKRYFNLLLDIFTREDCVEIYSKKIGINGSMGGKFTGIFVANKILMEKLGEEYNRYFSSPKYFVLDTKEFVDFLNFNNLHEAQGIRWDVEEAIRSGSESRISAVKTKLKILQQKILEGYFPPKTMSHMRMLFEETFSKGRPIIARSSSYLEDNYNTPFAGKYQSYFIPNSSDYEDENFADFITATKKVYSSALDFDALIYRYENDLFIEEEEMAVGYQEVIGKKRNGVFAPLFSGVIYSRAPRAFSNKFDLSDGMVELVLGLGPRVVDQSDYTRMVYFSHPALSPATTLSRKLKYSQKEIDVINILENKYEISSIDEWLKNIISDSEKNYDLKRLKLVHENKDGMLMPVLLPEKDADYIVNLDTFFNERPLSNLFIKNLKTAKDILKRSFGFDVDIEFVADFYINESKRLIPKINIIQCRPQYISPAFSPAEIPTDINEDNVFYRSFLPSTDGKIKEIEYMLFVDPELYGTMTSENISEVKRLIRTLNLELNGKNIVLVGPGRWGSSNRSLGIPVVYSEINNVKALIEYGIERAPGDLPELSYGSHFFQDIDRAGIHVIPMISFLKGNITYFNSEMIANSENTLSKFSGFNHLMEKGVKLIHFPSSFAGKFLSIYMNHTNKKQPNILMILEKK